MVIFFIMNPSPVNDFVFIYCMQVGSRG